MAIERCILCGGSLNKDKICTECGMDNKKNDKHYILNENLQTVRSVESQRDVRQGQPQQEYQQQRQTAKREEKPVYRPDFSHPYRGSYGKPLAGSRSSYGGSGMAGKVVFLVVLLIVIGTAVIGFVQEEKETTHYSGEAEDILDEAAEEESLEEKMTNATGTYTLHSENGIYTAEITMMDNQVYCYASDGYFSSMAQDSPPDEDISYRYTFDEYTSLDEAKESYMDYSWMEDDDTYEDLTVSEVQEMEVNGRTAYWAQADYTRNGNRIREMYLWTQVGDVLFCIRVNDSVYSEETEFSGNQELLAEALENVEFY
mgnify:CR=1 FL=1